MKEDSLIEQIRSLNYPRRVDVVDKVMEQVTHLPLLASSGHRRAVPFRRAVAAVAVTAVCCLGVNGVLLSAKHYNVRQMSQDLVSLYHYDNSASTYDFGVIESLVETEQAL